MKKNPNKILVLFRYEVFLFILVQFRYPIIFWKNQFFEIFPKYAIHSFS